ADCDSIILPQGTSPAPPAIFLRSRESKRRAGDTHQYMNSTLHGLEGIIVPAITFVFVAAIVITAMYFKHQRRPMWHETARLALEKGQPLPAIPNDDWRQRRRGCDVRTGLILIAVGIGLFLMFSSMSDKHGSGYVGAIPGLIGVALLLHGV